ncbi:MAG: hypothetical protein ACLQUT_06315 [Thermoleophilia bacterium]
MDEPAGQNGAVLSRLWMRFSAYTISDGPLPVIRPKQTATVDYYDPWEVDRRAPSEEQRPYKQLLRLAQQADFSQTRFDLPRRQRQRLEQWVRKNGLLGILPHETLAYRSEPHWHERPLAGNPTAASEPQVRQLAPYQLAVTRTGAGWSTTFSRVGRAPVADNVRPGDCVDPKFVNKSVLPAEITYRSWPQGEIIKEPVGKRFMTFFPADSRKAAEEREYPSPTSLAFWQDYGEPLGLVLRYAWHLSNALAAFAVSPGREPFQTRNAELFLQQINDAAFGTSLAGWLADEGSVHLQWSSSSLLGCFAIMILEDLARGQRVMRCPVCGGVFLSGAHQAKFCSTTCRYTYHKREQRRREASPGGVQ